MAPSFLFSQNLPVNLAYNELENNPPKVYIKNTSFSTPFLCKLLLAPIPAFILAFAFALDIQIGKYTDKDLQKATQIMLNFFI